MLESTNSAYRFSLFKNLITTDKPDLCIDINDIYQIIKFGFLKNETENLRKTNDKQTYSNLKKISLQAVTVSGLFNYRNKDGLIKHSGLIQIDILHIETNDHIYHKICNDPYTYLAFKNLDGNGINVIVKIKPSVKTHLSQFLALKKYYKIHYNVFLNTADIDVSKVTLLSNDPNIYINPYANIFESFLKTGENKKTGRQTTNNNKLHFVYLKNKEENRVAQIVQLLTAQKINLLNSDERKLEIGFSIANTLGEKGRRYYHKISAVSHSYNANEVNTFYNNLIQKNKDHITLATFIHYAKEVGITTNRPNDISNDINKHNLQKLYKKLKTKRLEVAIKYGK